MKGLASLIKRSCMIMSLAMEVEKSSLLDEEKGHMSMVQEDDFNSS